MIFFEKVATTRGRISRNILHNPSTTLDAYLAIILSHACRSQLLHCCLLFAVTYRMKN